MKKAIIVLLCCAMFLGTVSCNKSNDICLENGENSFSNTSSNATENKATSDEVNNKSLSSSQNQENDNKDELKALKKFKYQLNDLMIGNTPETLYWPDLGSDSSLSFAIVDMDGDNFSEVIVEHFGEHAVFHYVSEDEQIHAIDFYFRDLYNVMKDGTFAWNRTSNAGHEYGAGKLIFYGTYFTRIELYTIRNDGTEDEEYFIFGQRANKKALDAFDAQLSHERADFYDLTKENIEKYITVENFIR